MTQRMKDYFKWFGQSFLKAYFRNAFKYNLIIMFP